MKKLSITICILLALSMILIGADVVAETTTTSAITSTTKEIDYPSRNTYDLVVNGNTFDGELLFYDNLCYINKDRLSDVLTLTNEILKSVNGAINTNKPISLDITNAPDYVLIKGIKYEPIEKIVDTNKYKMHKITAEKAVYLDTSSYLNSLINQVEIEATLLRDVTVYSSKGLSGRLGTMKKGTIVRIKAENTPVSYRVSNGKLTGWVKDDYMHVSTKNYSNKAPIKQYVKENFVNTRNFKSDTKYLVWVNIERQDVNVFSKGKDGKWGMIKTFRCSSGKNATPTINGEFAFYCISGTIAYPGFHIENFMRFQGHYGMHSILLKSNERVYDGRLGTPLSHGCVRIGLSESKWVRSTIPLKTKIAIY